MSIQINGTTGISGVAGSVSAPMLTGDDANCGISFPAADTIKFSTGGVERMQITDSGVSGSGLGKILQVVSTIKNDTASTSSGTYAAISGLTVSITPSATSSKILYSGSLYLASSSSESVFRLTRTVGGSATEIATPSTFADDEDGTFAHGGGSRYGGQSFEFLDSPNTTSAITYGIKWQVHSGTTYLNRTWDANWFHGISTVTVMEVAA
jgi:hypothetical protein